MIPSPIIVPKSGIQGVFASPYYLWPEWQRIEFQLRMHMRYHDGDPHDEGNPDRSRSGEITHDCVFERFGDGDEYKAVQSNGCGGGEIYEHVTDIQGPTVSTDAGFIGFPAQDVEFTGPGGGTEHQNDVPILFSIVPWQKFNVGAPGVPDGEFPDPANESPDDMREEMSYRPDAGTEFGILWRFHPFFPPLLDFTEAIGAVAPEMPEDFSLRPDSTGTHEDRVIIVPGHEDVRTYEGTRFTNSVFELKDLPGREVEMHSRYLYTRTEWLDYFEPGDYHAYTTETEFNLWVRMNVVV